MGTSKIEWTERTWNPTTGCNKVSQGCKNCYAEAMANRFKAMGLKGYENGFKLAIHEDRISEPLRRKKPAMYFVNSMSDLFHERIEAEFLDRLFSVMQATPYHRYQILTKRPEVMQGYFSSCGRKVPKNVWLGVSVENRLQGLPRVDILRQIPCRIRFLSCEPLLADLGDFSLAGIDWVIVGGESGRNARPMLPSWAIDIKNQCKKEGVPFFFKQWGAYNQWGRKVGKVRSGRLLLGREWNEYPDYKRLEKEERIKPSACPYLKNEPVQLAWV